MKDISKDVRGYAIMECDPLCSMKIHPLCTFFLRLMNLMLMCFDAELLLLFEYKTVDLLS